MSMHTHPAPNGPQTRGAKKEVIALVAAAAVATIILLILLFSGGMRSAAVDVVVAPETPTPGSGIIVEPVVDPGNGTSTGGNTGAETGNGGSGEGGQTGAGSEEEEKIGEGEETGGFPDHQGKQPEGPGPDTGGEGPDGPLEPVEPTNPHPCEDVLAAGRNLLVTPDPKVLDPGHYQSSLTITNCGDSPVDWTAATKPWVTLGNEAGNIGPLSTSELSFDIDRESVDLGAFTFKIKVSEPGANTYVDIHGFRQPVGSDFVPEDLGFTAQPGSGGCSLQCITSALLTPNATTPNVSLEVKTKVPAKLRVWVSQQAPVFDADGVPSFPGKSAIAKNNSYATEWTGTLKPLQEDTKYYIIVKAIDENGKSAFRNGSFKTTTPVDLPDQFEAAGEEPGCSMQCITKAWVSRTDDFSIVELEVESHTPARLAAFLSTEPTTWEQGLPVPADDIPTRSTVAEFVETWDTSFHQLEPSTTYYIVVRATDVNGNQDYQAGTFTTAAKPAVDIEVGFHLLTIKHDGDGFWGGRGELSFGWAVEDDVVGGLGEKKRKDGDRISFPSDRNTWTVHGVDEALPQARIAAFERDPDLLAELCAMGTGVPTSHGGNGDCDLKWNVALTPDMVVDDIAGLTPCSEFGIEGDSADAGCLEIATTHSGKDYPTFTAIVSYEVV